MDGSVFMALRLPLRLFGWVMLGWMDGRCKNKSKLGGKLYH